MIEIRRAAGGWPARPRGARVPRRPAAARRHRFHRPGLGVSARQSARRGPGAARQGGATRPGRAPRPGHAAPARVAAFRTLARVRAGATLADAVARERETLGDARDRSLAHDLATGVLRWRSALDAALATASSRAIARVDADVLDILRLGVYQMRHRDRLPAHAVVSDAVALTRFAGHTSAAGFVNAVLRRLATHGGRCPAIGRGRCRRWAAAGLDALATQFAHPAWLVARWTARLGVDAAIGVDALRQRPGAADAARAAVGGHARSARRASGVRRRVGDADAVGAGGPRGHGGQPARPGGGRGLRRPGRSLPGRRRAGGRVAGAAPSGRLRGAGRQDAGAVGRGRWRSGRRRRSPAAPRAPAPRHAGARRRRRHPDRAARRRGSAALSGRLRSGAGGCAVFRAGHAAARTGSQVAARRSGARRRWPRCRPGCWRTPRASSRQAGCWSTRRAPASRTRTTPSPTPSSRPTRPSKPAGPPPAAPAGVGGLLTEDGRLHTSPVTHGLEAFFAAAFRRRG